MKLALILTFLSRLFNLALSDSAEDLSNAVKALSHANNLFTEDVFREIVNIFPQDNVISSPFSLGSVLAMVKTGAMGQTAEELRLGLRLENMSDPNSVHEGYSDIIFSLHDKNSSVAFQTGNRVYIDDSFSVNDNFMKIVKQKYFSLIEMVNFSQTTELAKQINRFVTLATNGVIKNMVSADTLDPLTKMTLINAIYFKGSWKYQFPKESTYPGEFQSIAGIPVPTYFMQLDAAPLLHTRVEELNSNVVAIPYVDDRFFMLIILPNEGVPIRQVENKLSFGILEKIPLRVQEQRVTLTLPKFTLNSNIDFAENGILQKLGMKSMLTGKADLRGISDTLGLFLSSILQKAHVEVNEEGTEVAGSSAGLIVTKSAESPVIQFKVDRPFLSYIYDTTTQTILFIMRKVK